MDELMARAQERHRVTARRPPWEMEVEITGEESDECFCLHLRGPFELDVPLHATQAHELWYLLAEAYSKWQAAATGLAPLDRTTHKEALLGLGVRVVHKRARDCVRVTVQHAGQGRTVSFTLHAAEVADLQTKIGAAYSRWQMAALAEVLALFGDA
jgi:hypothetical protein